jgi:hypothetical protein
MVELVGLMAVAVVAVGRRRITGIIQVQVGQAVVASQS